MEHNSFFAVQFNLNAKPEDVERGIAMIRSAFNLTQPEITPAQIVAEQQNQAAAAAAIDTAATAHNLADLDANGLPWDGRIHAGTKTKTQKNEWKKLKGVSDATVAKVTAELRAMMGTANAPAVATVTAPPAATITAPSVPTIPAAAKTPYNELVDWLAKNTGEGTNLPQSWVDSVFAQNGTTLAALANNQESAAEFLKAFQAVQG